jgi:hypothetical protein
MPCSLALQILALSCARSLGGSNGVRLGCSWEYSFRKVTMITSRLITGRDQWRASQHKDRA